MSNMETDSEDYETSETDREDFETDEDYETDDEDCEIEEEDHWFTNLALFGDSNAALFSSFAVLILSFLVSLHADGNLPSAPWSLPPSERAYRNLEPLPDVAPPKIFHVSDFVDNKVSLEMHESFDRDGVIAVRGLLDPALLKALDGATEKIVREKQKQNEEKKKIKPKVLTGRGKRPQQFFTVDEGAMFVPMNESTTSPFVEVALQSNIPGIVADLLYFDSESCTNTTLRVMRDIFLAKDEEEYICGWHVDDVGFWPALVEEPGEPIGINAWIALDDMPIESGGGFALAVGSHATGWKDEAYESIGSTHTYPKGGFNSSRDVLQNRPGNGTCNIEHTSPHLHRRMEETKRVYDIKAGDVIFHTRWLFHRTIPFDREGVSSRAADKEDPLVYRRYSIRYGPGNSIIPPGFGSEPSVLSDVKNGGRTADEVSKYDSAWYPRAWPSASEVELEQMKILAEDRLPKALKRSAERKKITRPRVKREGATA